MRLSSEAAIVGALMVVNVIVLSGLLLYSTASQRPSPSSAAAVSAGPPVASPVESKPSSTATLTEPTASATPTQQLASNSQVVQTSVTSIPSQVPRSAPTTSPSPIPAASRVLPPQASPNSVEPSAVAALPTSSPVAESTAALIQRLREQEASVRSGRLTAVLNLGTGQSSVSEVLFDLGRADPRLQSSTTYKSAQGSRTIEWITVGGRAWQRQANGSWTPTSEGEGAVGRLRDYLPGVSGSTGVRLDNSDLRTSTLRWYDPTRDADVTVDIDAATGVPLFMSRVARGTHSILTVSYVGWDTAVDIEPSRGG